jgi:hypothetical protein
MSELKPCPICGAKLKKKITFRKEVVFDHPRNGCKNEGDRVRFYKESIEAWNRRCSDV